MEQALTDKVALLRAGVAAAETSTTERANVVHHAQAHIEAARSDAQVCSAALGDAEAAKRESEEVLKVAVQAVKSFTPELKRATKVRDNLQAEFELFCQGPKESYDKL